MGCTCSKVSKEPPLILNPSDTCPFCLESVGDEEGQHRVVLPQPTTNGAVESHDLEDWVKVDRAGTAEETNLMIRVSMDRKGGPWMRLDCGHVCHKACLEAQVKVCTARRPQDKLTFAHLGCTECRQDLVITDPNQKANAKYLQTLLREEYALRAKVTKALLQHAREDPVDKIEGLDKMAPQEQESVIARRIGAFKCSKCQDIFCEGTICAAGDDSTQKETLCPGCIEVMRNGPKDFSKCPEPIYKCDLCCSVAKYRCPDFYQCEKHHCQPGGNCKTIEKCPGGCKCPLGVEHPPNAHIKRGFILGCGCGKCK